MTAGLPRSPPEDATPRPFDDDHAPLYTVGQVADMLSVQPAFLRRLDAEAVVRPARSDGGQRRYTRLEILLVEKVVGLAEEGLTLAGIRRLIVLEDRIRDLQDELTGYRDQQPQSPALRHNDLGGR